MKSKYDKIQQIISNMKQPDYRYLQITNAAGNHFAYPRNVEAGLGAAFVQREQSA